MSFKTVNSKNNLDIWRKFRQQNFDSVEQLVENFPYQKFESRYLDYYTPKSWPSPFEIVSEGYLCQSGITLVLTATLFYKKFVYQDEISLPVISNNITGSTGLVLINNNQAFNFTPGKIESFDYVKENSTIFQWHKVSKDQLFLDI